MKKIGKIGLLGGGLILGGMLLLHFVMPAPVAIVKNETDTDVKVRLETDVDESYQIGVVAAGGVARTKISRRDKAIWAVAMFPDGRTIESNKLYATTQGTLSVRLTKEVIEARYEM